MAGRPTKRSAAREEVILNALRLGNTRTIAAAYAEVHRDTFYEWMRDPTFSDAVEKAEADAEARFVGQIVKAAHGGTWQAAAWWLERRNQNSWGKRIDVNIRAIVEQYATQNGLDPVELLDEAERILAEHVGDSRK